MADLLARFNPGDGYVYLTSGDAYPIPQDLWKVLRSEPFCAAYSEARRGELRLTKPAGDAAVAQMRSEGHQIVTATGGRSRPMTPAARGPMECRTCGQPYITGKKPSHGEFCINPDTVRDAATGERVPTYPAHALVLVPPPQ